MHAIGVQETKMEIVKVRSIWGKDYDFCFRWFNAFSKEEEFGSKYYAGIKGKWLEYIECL